MIFGLFPLLLIVIIGFAAYAVVQTRHRGSVAPHSLQDREGDPTPTGASQRRGPDSPDLAADLARWVDAGLISEEQSAAIEAYAHETTSPAVPAVAPSIPTRDRRVPAFAEALGYLGGVLAMSGLVLFVARSWHDIPMAGRLALSGGGAAALLIAGVLVREKAEPALARLRWFLWLAATASTAVFVAVLSHDAFDIEPARQVAIFCSAAVAVLSGLLWMWRERPVQQLTCLAGLAVFVGTLVTELTDIGPGGLAVWGLGAVLLVAGLRELTPLHLLTEGIAALMAAAGALISMAAWNGFGLIFAVVTGVLLVTIAVVHGLTRSRAAEIIAGVIGGVLLLQSVPSTLGYFGRDAGLVTGLVTWVAGAASLYVGVQRVIRLPVLAEIVGGLGLVGGAALTGLQLHGFAPLFGIATALGLVALGMVPGRVLMSVFGSLGLLVNVPWAIGWFFPGEGRAPLLILVCGVMIIAVAVLLTRLGGRFRSELHSTRRGGPRHGAPPRGIAPTHP